MYTDACFDETTRADCHSFYNGLLTHGLHSAIAEFVNTGFKLVKLRDPPMSFEEQIQGNATALLLLQRDIILNPMFEKLRAMSRGYFMRALRRSARISVEEVTNLGFIFIKKRVVVFSSFVVVVTFIYFTILNRYFQRLNRHIQQARAMLLVLPAEAMVYVNSIRKYIQRVANESQSRL